jgi:O-antigen/teichoic acid export membrane protein
MGKSLTVFASLVSAAILSRLFTKDDYAAYRQTILVFVVAIPLLTSGLPKSLYYFIPRNRENSRSILTGNLLLLFLMGALFTVIIMSGGNRFIAMKFSNPAIARLLLIYSPYAMFALPILNIDACLMSCNRVKTLVVYNVISRFFTVILIVGFVLIWRTPTASICAIVLAGFIIFIPAIFLMYQATAGDAWKFNAANIWQQIKYSVPLGIASMFGKIDMVLDKIIVSAMCTPALFAVYVNGALEIPVIGILTGSITSVLLPDIVQFYNEGNKTAGLELWKRASVKSAMLLMPIMCFLMVMAGEFMQILFSAKYSESAWPFRVYLLLMPVRVVTWGPMLMAAGKTRLVLYGAAGGLVMNLILSIILVHKIGYMGAVIGTVLSIYIWNIPFYIIAISNLYQVSFWRILPFWNLFKILLISAIPAIVCYLKVYLPVSNDIIMLAITAIVYAGILLMLMLKFEFLKMKDIMTAIYRLRRVFFDSGKGMSNKL